MIKVGITGQNGFIGSHVYRTLGLYTNEFVHVDFKRDFFNDPNLLDQFVRQCDVIVHLAALNRHEDMSVLRDTNIQLVEMLVSSLQRTRCKPHVLISSSTQEERENQYGESKRVGRRLLASWAEENNALFTGMIIPNVYGPFGVPFYNSVVATFCHLLTHGGEPKIHQDGELKLIYVQELANIIIKCIREKTHKEEYKVAETAQAKVSEILLKLKEFEDKYLNKGEIPVLEGAFDINLFNTFRSYIAVGDIFPRKFTQHTDNRGSFVEVIRLGIGGQVSFSTTVPGITRGNHYHTRKIERFAVIKGKALIQLRKIGTKEVHDFYLDGDEPAYVDMPVWYTHNIKNVGNEILYTNFWINEPYDPTDADTYFEEV